MLTISHHRRSYRDRVASARTARERGAVIVEAVFVTPVLIFLILGIIEWGLYFKDNLTVANGTRAGARAVSSSSIDGYADHDMLMALARNLPGLDHDVRRIIVYKANSNGFDTQPPTSCLSGNGVNGVCNVYTTADTKLTRAQFGAVGYTKDNFWPGQSRDVYSGGAVGTANPPGTDFIGVYIEYRHENVTGVFGRAVTIKDRVVMRIEPKQIAFDADAPADDDDD